MKIRRSGERGRADHGWLKSLHTFSFADYYDPEHMGFHALRVINEDRVAPGEGFPRHPHRDMEIVSYVLDGALEHRDSLGNGSIIRPGEVQRMSAGTGVAHSEYNASQDEPVHFLQIWIVPERRGIEPGYEQKGFSEDERRGRLRLVASRDGRAGSVTIHQDAAIYAALLDDGTRIEHTIPPGRHAWLHVARGSITLDDTPLEAGDAAAIEDATTLAITGRGPAEVLLFDVG